MLQAVLFDLDGTLLPMDQDEFVQAYFGALAHYAAPYGYEAKSLIHALWKGTEAMVRNDGGKLNHAVFWDAFTACLGAWTKDHEPIFDRFYETEFAQARAACAFAPEAAQTIAYLKSQNIRCVLATNPIFPRTATQQRIRWAGLRPEDFELITTYENSRRCKPNPDYFTDIAQALRLTPSECLMVGNDRAEDGAATAAGFPVFLLTPCLIDQEGLGLDGFPHGDFSALHMELTRRISENR